MDVEKVVGKLTLILLAVALVFCAVVGAWTIVQWIKDHLFFA